MIVSMAKSNNTSRSKSRSHSKSKNKSPQVGNSYRIVRTVKSKSRSVPKQRLSHERAAFNTNPKMETIDEPAARILNQKETRTSI